MIEAEISETVPFYDTDCGGVVSNIAYLRYVEKARTGESAGDLRVSADRDGTGRRAAPSRGGESGGGPDPVARGPATSHAARVAEPNGVRQKCLILAQLAEFAYFPCRRVKAY